MGNNLMCGICGVVAFRRPPELETARRMAALLAHRGPDGSGEFVDDYGVAFGHRRLAIIDLSDAGLQPFASSDGRFQLMHNGEIYNYVELRRELEDRGHTFRTATDTEVVLEAYREWGSRCVERFNGMWAIAIWDSREKTLFCSRDRFGVKPFYYRWDGVRLVFASELKAFRADPLTRLEPNESVAREYIEQGYVDYGEETFFAGIRRLPPAHSLTLSPAGFRVSCHWQLEPVDAPADPVAAVRELFLDAVRLRLRSDVPIGTALSGGLDSSAVAGGVAHLQRRGEGGNQVGPKQQVFTAYFDDAGFDERPYAEAVVRAIDADPHWVTFADDEVEEIVSAVVEAQDEPFGSLSIVAQWLVMRAAREASVTVMLDGQGGDETLAGYPVTFGYRFADLLAQRSFLELGRELQAYRRIHGAPASTTAISLATPFLPMGLRRALRARRQGARALLGPALRSAPEAVETNESPFSDRLRRQYHHILADRGLPELLRYEDRNSMAHSLEARVPFLDYRLVELLFSIDASYLLNRGVTKTVLRQAVGDLLPATVLARTDKLGFVTPDARFLRGQLGVAAERVFASRALAARGFIDPKHARERLSTLRRGLTSTDAPLWRALNLELWAGAFVD